MSFNCCEYAITLDWYSGAPVRDREREGGRDGKGEIRCIKAWRKVNFQAMSRTLQFYQSKENNFNHKQKQIPQSKKKNAEKYTYNRSLNKNFFFNCRKITKKSDLSRCLEAEYVFDPVMSI